LVSYWQLEVVDPLELFGHPRNEQESERQVSLYQQAKEQQNDPKSIEMLCFGRSALAGEEGGGKLNAMYSFSQRRKNKWLKSREISVTVGEKKIISAECKSYWHNRALTPSPALGARCSPPARRAEPTWSGVFLNPEPGRRPTFHRSGWDHLPKDRAVWVTVLSVLQILLLPCSVG